MSALISLSADASRHADFTSHSILCVAFQSHRQWKHFRKLWTWSTSSVQVLLSRGNCRVVPVVAGLVTLRLFQHCLPRTFVVFLFSCVWSGFLSNLLLPWKTECSLDFFSRGALAPPRRLVRHWSSVKTHLLTDNKYDNNMRIVWVSDSWSIQTRS